MHRTYENDDLAVFWDSEKCFHAKRCVGKSADVFDPTRKPWIDLNKGTSAEIWQAVSGCPSGALTCVYKHGIDVKMAAEDNMSIALHGDKLIGRCTYSVEDGGLKIEHTIVDEQYRGKGVAKRLVFAVLEYAERKSLSVIPVCPYAKEIMM